MSNVSTSNMLQLVVGTAGQPDNIPATPNLLGPGEVGAYTEGGKLAVAADRKFFIARGGEVPGKFMRTDIIDRDSRGAVENYKAGVAAAHQVTHVGWNGVSGEIDNIADNMYYVRLYLQEFLGSASDARVVKHAVFHSGVTPVDSEVAAAIAASCNANMSRDPEDKIHATAACNAAANVTAIAATTLANSNVVTSAAAHALAVGDYVRLESATDLGKSVYLVTEVVDTTTFKVMNVFGRKTVTVNAYKIPAANVTGATKWGVRFEGQDLDWTRGRISHGVVIFDTALEDFGSTGITNTTAASKGVFTGKEVSDLETFAQGYYGEEFRVGQPALFAADAYADANTLYNGHRWNTVNDEVVGIGATPTSKKEFLVALPASETGSDISDLLGELGADIA